MENIRIIDATPSGTATFEFLIDEQYSNINNVMHGGAGGVIFDMCTTFALGPVAKPGSWEYVFLSLRNLGVDLRHMIMLTGSSFLGGVTRTLNLSYLRAVPVGT